jgi:hypothetical protein
MIATLLAVAGSGLFVPTASAGGEVHLDVEVGVDSTGKLKVEFADPYELPLLGGGLLAGWGSDDPGFANLEADEPAEDLFVLDPDANIEVEFVSVDDAFNMWIPPFFGEILDTPGERWDLGGSVFDIHPFWHIDSDDPGFNPLQTEWEITLKLVDTRPELGVAHADSDPFTLRFNPVPEPATVALLSLAGMGLLRRRVLE